MNERAKAATKHEAKKENSLSQNQKTDFSQSIDSPPEHILHLQRTIGNQAVQRLFKSGIIQAKLKVSQPEDIYEQEADRVAEQVMGMPDAAISNQRSGVCGDNSSLRMKTGRPLGSGPPCGEEEIVKRQVLPEGISRSAEDRDHSSDVAPSTESSIRSLVGGGQPLPQSERAFFEPRFGADFSGVRLHSNSQVGELAQALQATAFTIGSNIVFGCGQYPAGTSEGRKLLSHELTHVVQQRNHLLQRKGEAAPKETVMPYNTGAHNASETIQRFAFIKEKQIEKVEPGWAPEMKTMVSDNLVRNYESKDEFKNHAVRKTDYLGNLVGTAKAGTWLRFHPTGMNILGEYHNLVTLFDVAPAVGSKNFVYEIFSADLLSSGSATKAAYEKEVEPESKRFGIEKEPDKQKFGAESLFPKMGVSLISLRPYFEKIKPIADLKTGHYLGQVDQRYLKIAWGYSKDVAATAAKWPNLLLPQMQWLAFVYNSVEAKLDTFITSLPVEGYLGDELDKPGNENLFLPLAEFARAFTDAMVEMAALAKSSRLSAAERQKLLTGTGLDDEKKRKLFEDWRNYNFEDNVKNAATRGVRYAGMGQFHLDYLKNVGLPSNGHPYEMAGKDLHAFEALTKKLQNEAKKP